MNKALVQRMNKVADMKVLRKRQALFQIRIRKGNKDIIL